LLQNDVSVSVGWAPAENIAEKRQTFWMIEG